MFTDYARYYLTFGLQLMTALGLVLGGPYAWLGLSTLFIFAVADELLPLDYRVRHIDNRRLANIPVWLCTVTGPLLILLLAWTAAHGHFAGIHWFGAVISVAWMSVIAFVPPSHEGVAVALGSMIVARFWVESFNYFQHYGIVRAPGKPIARRHLWNHLGYFTRVIAFEITNHADHHLDSYIPYYKLKPDTTAIRMPNVFLCFLCALIPPLWHNVIIKPALKRWDLEFASAEERQLARTQNLAAGWPDWFAETPAAAAAV